MAISGRQHKKEIIYLILYPTLLYAVGLYTVKQSHFIINPICNMQARIENGCATPLSASRTSMDCVSSCNEDDACLGSSVSSQSECFIHKRCTAKIACDQEEVVNFTHFVKSDRPMLCNNQYRYHFEDANCKCKDGWIGQYCQRLGQTCGELTRNGYKGSEDVTLDIYKNGSLLVETTCFFLGRKIGFLTILRTSGQPSKFNRTWDEYVSGFGIGEPEYWLGLENLYQLNKAGCTLFDIYLYMSNYTTNRIRRNYKQVQIKDSSKNYEMSFSQARTIGKNNSESLRGCLRAEKNVPFSTWDSDNDGDAGHNCASVVGAGWWYPSCNLSCNLLGYRAGDPLPGFDSETMAAHFRRVLLVMRNEKLFW